MGETFTLKRGLENVFAAKVIADTETEFTTGTPFHLIPAGELSVSVENDSTDYYFDNTVFARVGREGGSEVTVSGAGLRAAAIAGITGKDIDAATGAVLDEGIFNDGQYYALGALKNNIDGTSEYFWFLKGTFALPDESAKTKGEDTDASGTELTYTAIPTIHKFTETSKVCKRVVIDTETTAISSGADWFDQVVTPDNISTVVELVTNTATETFSGDDSETTFTLANTPVSVTSVTVDGSARSAVTDYTVSGSTITFETAPATGTNNISVTYTYTS